MVPSEWKDDPSRLWTKDTKARWTRTNGVTHFGFKNPVSVAHATKLKASWDVTSANGPASQVFEALLDSSPSGALRVCAARGLGTSPLPWSAVVSSRDSLSIRNGTNARYMNGLGITKARVGSGLVNLCDTSGQFIQIVPFLFSEKVG